MKLHPDTCSHRCHGNRWRED